MRIRRTFHTIDTHTGGEPTRTVVGGMPVIPGATMKDKMLYMMGEGDWLRQLLVFEPRGNEVMSGTLITPPCRPDADLGVLYFEVGGWMPMCGHDTIGVATALVESGMVPVTEPVTEIALDTAAGLVRVSVDVEEGIAKRVTFINAPAFMLAENAVVKTGEWGDISLDIAYGGNIYAILPAASLGLDIKPENASEIVAKGNRLKKAINTQIPVAHPQLPFMNQVTHVEFFQNAETKEDGLHRVRNAVVIPPGAIDRSPCGTGTSAKLAVLAAKGHIKPGGAFIHESIIGSEFVCRYVTDTTVAGKPAVVPQVTGSAWVTGIHTFMLDPEDPFPRGFELK